MCSGLLPYRCMLSLALYPMWPPFFILFERLIKFHLSCLKKNLERIIVAQRIIVSMS